MSKNTFSVSVRIRNVARKILPKPLKDWLNAHVINPGGSASSDYHVLGAGPVPDLSRGWQDPSVGEKQYAAFKPVMDEMYHGRPREDFTALAAAIKMTGLLNPRIIEVGSGNGWNSEVISYLTGITFSYCGIDISQRMAAIGRKVYPGREFLIGDATSLPVRDQSCDILLSGTVLMHLPRYKEAIAESFRVSRRWCIFHTVPVMKNRQTTLLEKRAYGQPAVEVIFNEAEFVRSLEESGFSIKGVIDSLPYDLDDVLGEPTVTKTFICEVRRI